MGGFEVTFAITCTLDNAENKTANYDRQQIQQIDQDRFSDLESFNGQIRRFLS